MKNMTRSIKKKIGTVGEQLYKFIGTVSERGKR
jgi:hypothetical protein